MRTRVSVFACVVLAAAAGCSREQTAEPPVATPSVTLNKDRAAIGSPLKMTYRSRPLAKIDGDYSVFVHVMDPEGEKLWQDDHQPPMPTSTWKTGSAGRIHPDDLRSELSRTSARRSSGSVSTTRRRASACRSERRRHPGTSTWFESSTLLPQSENIFLIYRDGWHPPEIDPNDPTSEWQWTKKNATVVVPQSEEGRDLLSRVRRASRSVHPAAAGDRRPRGAADRRRSRPTRRTGR